MVKNSYIKVFSSLSFWKTRTLLGSTETSGTSLVKFYRHLSIRFWINSSELFNETPLPRFIGRGPKLVLRKLFCYSAIPITHVNYNTSLRTIAILGNFFFSDHSASRNFISNSFGYKSNFSMIVGVERFTLDPRLLTLHLPRFNERGSLYDPTYLKRSRCIKTFCGILSKGSVTAFDNQWQFSEGAAAAKLGYVNISIFAVNGCLSDISQGLKVGNFSNISFLMSGFFDINCLVDSIAPREYLRWFSVVNSNAFIAVKVEYLPLSGVISSSIDVGASFLRCITVIAIADGGGSRQMWESRVCVGMIYKFLLAYRFSNSYKVFLRERFSTFLTPPRYFHFQYHQIMKVLLKVLCVAVRNNVTPFMWFCNYPMPNNSGIRALVKPPSEQNKLKFGSSQLITAAEFFLFETFKISPYLGGVKVSLPSFFFFGRALIVTRFFKKLYYTYTSFLQTYLLGNEVSLIPRGWFFDLASCEVRPYLLGGVLQQKSVFHVEFTSKIELSLKVSKLARIGAGLPHLEFFSLYSLPHIREIAVTGLYDNPLKTFQFSKVVEQKKSFRVFDLDFLNHLGLMISESTNPDSMDLDVVSQLRNNFSSVSTSYYLDMRQERFFFNNFDIDAWRPMLCTNTSNCFVSLVPIFILGWSSIKWPRDRVTLKVFRKKRKRALSIRHLHKKLLTSGRLYWRVVLLEIFYAL